MTKPPPMLLGATLAFWGWQSGLFLPGLLMGLLLEAAYVFKVRWEFTNEDFQKIWTFCTLLLLSSLVYAFTANEGPADVRGFFQNPNYATQRNAGVATAKTAASVIRWLPMLFFLFVGAQAYSSREAIPLETISLILRRRWRKAKKLGLRVPPSQNVHVGYSYFAMCLVASTIGSAEDSYFFWALCVLLPWALWPLRPRRYHVAIWGGVIAVTIVLGYLGQKGIGELARYMDGFNSQLFARWARGRFDASQSRTDLGRLGRMKTSMQILMRVETPPGNPAPPLLREATYRSLRSTVWYAEAPRVGFEGIQPETNQTTWVLLPGKTNRAAVNVACYLTGRSGGFNTGLLPLPSGSGTLENLSAYLLSKNNLGAVLAQGPGLIVYDALYGPGTTIDSPPSSDDTEVPFREREAVEKICNELGLLQKTPEEARDAIQKYFQEHFKYSTWQERDLRYRTNDTPLARFLLRTRSGHCEYFASSTVLLLRQANIPARYAVGYAVHESNGPRKYVVRDRDAHAWTLVWNADKSVWEDFDTTPASWLEAEAQPSSLQWLKDAWSWIQYQVSRLRWGQTKLRQYILWTVIPILGLLLYQIIFRRRGRKRQPREDASLRPVWPGLDSEFYQLTQRLEKRGCARMTGESLTQWLSRALKEPGLEELREPVQRMLRMHYRYRFDPQGLPEDDRAQLRVDVQNCLARVR